jgi:hypothetical protein
MSKPVYLLKTLSKENICGVSYIYLLSLYTYSLERKEKKKVVEKRRR